MSLINIGQVSMASTFFGTTLVESANESSAKQKTPLDIVIYTASLASRPQAIDILMDPVRLLTSKLEPGQQLNSNNIQVLAAVYANLERYLTHNEPLRVYTTESIQKKILDKFKLDVDSLSAYWSSLAQNSSQMVQAQPDSEAVVVHAKQWHKLGRQITIWALVIGAASIFLPAQSCDQRFCNNFDMGFSVASDLLLLGSAFLFLKGLGGFKTRFKITYRLLCAAMVLLALAQSQQAIYTQFNLWSVPFIAHGGAAAGFVPGVILFYLSMYLFARLLRVKTFVTSVLAMLATAGVLIAVLLTVHLPTPLPPEVLRTALPPVLIMDTLLVYAALIVLAIKKAASPAYTPALAWLFLGLGTVALSTLTYTFIGIFLSSTENIFLSYGGVSALMMVAGILLVRSGVVFNQITDD